MDVSGGKPIPPRSPRAIFAALCIVPIAVIGFFLLAVLPHERAATIEQWRGRLSAMADDRRAAIARWLTASLADAQSAASFPTIVALASNPSTDVAGKEREHATSILASIAGAEGFDGGWVLDANGGVLVSTRGSVAPDPALLRNLVARLEAETLVTDIHRSSDGRVSAYYAARIRADGSQHRILGTVVFRSDPEKFLYPLLRSDPSLSTTAETVLVRADGSDVLFLGPLRHRSEAPLTVRLPRARLGAAAAAIEGRSEFGEFIDYRGMRVLAATRGIRGTPWGLVVKVDREEAFAAYRRSMREQLGMLAALVIGIAGVVYGLWRARRAAYEIRLAANQARLAILLDHAPDPILFLGPDLRVREANRRAEEFYGYGRGELTGLHMIDDLQAPEDRPAAAAQVAESEARERAVIPTTYLRRDGTRVPVELSVSRFDHELNGGRIAIVRDMSERHAAEQRIGVLVRTLKMSNSIHELMARETDRDALLEEACAIAVSVGGFRMAWVGLADRVSGAVTPVASAGVVDGYFDEPEVRAGLTPAGQGPIASALREGRTIVVNDTAADATYPSRRAARTRGYAAKAISPIQAKGLVIGVLVLCAEGAVYFDSEMLGVVEELADDLGFALQSIGDRDGLVESEERFRRLAENLPDVIYRRRLRPAPAYEYVSPAVAQLTGYAPSDFYADPHILEKLTDPAAFAHLTDPEAGGWGDAAVVPLRHRDGRTILLEYRRQPIRDPGGEVVAIEGIARDVTEEHRVLDELRRTTSTLRALVDSSPLAIFTVDAEGTVGIWNRAAERLLGWQAAEIQGKALPIASPENRAELEAVKDRVLRGEEFAGMELVGRHRKDGALVDISLSAAPILEPGGVAAMLCIAEDISARRAGEAELRKLSRAVEQSPVSIVITDIKGSIEYVNPKFTELTGYTRNEVLGKNPSILKSGEMPPELYRTLWQTITSGREWRGELRNSKKNGELFWEDAAISPILDERGRITHFLAVKEDITARKLLEAQFEQSQKMEAVGRLAGGVAHDFNNLLTVISGYTSLLLRDAEKDSRPGKALAEIAAASQRAAALTQQLLAFGRRQVLQPRPLRLAAVIAELEKMMRRLIGEDVVLSVSASEDLGTVVADPGQIEQVLINLAVNARDAMPGGGRLAIESSNAAVGEEAARKMPGLSPGEYVLLSVSDSGHGIPPEVLPHIFEPFFTTKEKGRGTGLGLATVYGIVKQSGGGIYVDTAMGAGTTFRIYLPRVADAPEEASIVTTEAAMARGSETILLVEDQDDVRSIVGRLLEDLGYRVIPVSDPREASARMRDAGAVALVLTDVVMPYMDGRTLSLQLREAQPGLKVLLMTGYTPDEALRSGSSSMEIALLQKPFRPEQLARKVREVLDARQAG